MEKLKTKMKQTKGAEKQIGSSLKLKGKLFLAAEAKKQVRFGVLFDRKKASYTFVWSRKLCWH